MKLYILLATIGLLSLPGLINEPKMKQEPVQPVIHATTGKSHVMIASAYTSTRGQTDDAPCIAADGSDICERFENGETLCATNDYPLGTKLFFQPVELEGPYENGICVVADRMNKRYKGHIDFYFGRGDEAYDAAIKFGRKRYYINKLD